MNSTKQHAVVVGGSSGIGLATAARLLATGIDVTIAGRDAARLARARTELGGDAQALPLDARDEAAVKAFFAGLGRFDHLVLSVGSGRGLGPFPQLDLADVRLGFEEKIWPQLACAQAALATLADNGSITFVSAVTANAEAPATAGIAAANGVLETVTPILAADLRPRRVNAVSPGVVDTDWWSFLPVDQKAAVFQDYGQRAPVGRIGAPDDIARAIAFLVTDGFMTGHVLVCDGGLRLAAA